MSSDVPSTNELLEAHIHIQNILVGSIKSSCLKCALELGILGIIHAHGNQMKFFELIDALSINKAKSDHLSHVLRVLVHSGFLSRLRIREVNDDSDDDLEEEGYCLTPISRILLRDEPNNLVSYVIGVTDPDFAALPASHLTQWFLDQVPNPFFAAHGMEFWDYLSHNSRMDKLFYEAMASGTGFISGILMRDFLHLFEGLTSIVDVGGATGIMASAISNALPHMKCIVFDLPNVVGDMVGKNNLTYVGVDMFNYIPHADGILLKWIMHDWDDEKCVSILKRCRDAIPRDPNEGKVIIIDIVVDENDDPKALEAQLALDIIMMMHHNGKERTKKEWTRLFFDAGFTSYKFTKGLGLESIIEVYPRLFNTILFASSNTISYFYS